MDKAAEERQVIVTWYKPEEKLPPEYEDVVTFSGKINKYVSYEHAIGIGDYFPGKGWLIDGMDWEESDAMTIEAWADLEPYGMR